MSISQNFPEEGPTLNLNFANSKTLDPRITFTRTSSATYTDDNGLIRVAPANSARFNHRFNPTTGEIESLGLLVEDQRSNLITYSQDFINSIWDAPVDGRSRATIVTRTGVDDPSGGTTAATFKNGGTLADELIWRTATGTANVPYTMSVWIRRRSGTGQIDLVVGDNITVEITNQVTNQWKRISLTATPTTTIVRAYILIKGLNDEIDVWGYQLEQGSFPTSYIPTTSTTATRTADNASITGSNFSDFYNPNEFTLLVSAKRDFITSSLVSYPNLLRLNEGVSDNNNTIALYTASNSNVITNFSITSGGVPYTDYVQRSFTIGKPFKVIQSLKRNSSIFGTDGVMTTTDTSVEMPVGIDRMFIGYDGGAGQRWGGTIQQLVYYPTALPSNQLITLTK